MIFKKSQNKSEIPGICSLEKTEHLDPLTQLSSGFFVPDACMGTLKKTEHAPRRKFVVQSGSVLCGAF